jgi:hypothetical protein
MEKLSEDLTEEFKKIGKLEAAIKANSKSI